MTLRQDVGPVPPDSMVQSYSGSALAEQYVVLGDTIHAFLVNYGGLQPHHKVLDVGCGIGLMARPLTSFLAPEGSYDGFDVVLEPIEWCRQHYREYPRFTFQRADVYNKHYNPKGRFTAREYVFPYPAGTFDMVVLTSVFTHLLPEDLTNYLAEIARVMKPGARCLITYFLLNPESIERIESWLKEHPDAADRGVPGGLGFRWKFGDHCRLYSKDVPETAVAYSERWLADQYASHGLSIDLINHGEWCRRSFQPGWQDLILAVKNP
ncbi:MAG TPA: class I SAM-dependent methyltransferase [Vicinamibacterales bacterium]|jgi:SAM-dependent methyltransferase|nr:class I SAM-dependent methyltransferase [Vicinamibacterales bacterium]